MKMPVTAEEWTALVSLIAGIDPKDVPDSHAALLQRATISLGVRIERGRRMNAIAKESTARLTLRTLKTALVHANGRKLVSLKTPKDELESMSVRISSPDEKRVLLLMEMTKSPDAILGMIVAGKATQGRGRKFDLADPNSEENIRQFIMDAGFELAPGWLSVNG
jgi:hypothetical protein